MRGLAREAEEGRLDAIRTREDAHALLEATDDGVLGLAKDGRCISVNRAAAMLLGYAGRELRGQDVHAALHHTTPRGIRRPREESPILAALAAGTEARSTDDDVLWRSDRTPLPVQWSLRPLRDERGVRGGVLTFSDMTEIRAKESALRRAVRVREEVVSVVSHDLRNPLGVVVGAADILLDLPLEEAERRKQLEIIRRSGKRMGRLVEDLLDVARIEAGALVVRTAPEAPESLLEETRSVFASQAEARGITLSLELDGRVPPVLADRDRVQQALANLVGNALKFTPRGGRIMLSAHAEGGDHVALSVTDTGPGVAPEERRLVFDRFWQASRHDRTGSGLGLAIVRGIAQVHGGSVDVSEAPGGGARFTLTLLTAAVGPARAERV
jgi:PAS domain S-box-containing protein